MAITQAGLVVAQLRLQLDYKTFEFVDYRKPEEARLPQQLAGQHYLDASCLSSIVNLYSLDCMRNMLVEPLNLLVSGLV